MSNKLYKPDMDDLIELHNTARSTKSWLWQIQPLSKDKKLMKYANDWVKWMAKNNKLLHSNIGDIMELGFNNVGENIAWGQKNENTVMNSWLWSPGHRANIMSRSYTKIGCAAAYSDYDHLYWCVCFGRENK